MVLLGWFIKGILDELGLTPFHVVFLKLRVEMSKS